MIMFTKLREVLLISAILTETIGVDYCAIATCAKGEHTMCKYPTDAVACPGEGVKTGLDDELRKVILDRHNEHRQTVALGKQSPQPHASNMMKLTWHDEAEKIAQRWADQCVFSHDSCRDLEDAKVGQNLATASLELESKDVKKTVVKMIDDWYGEVKDFDKGHVKEYQFDGETGHYTQIVWAETTGVGCGIIEKPPENKHYRMVTLACNYVPSGNYIGMSMYRIGKACSKCLGDECSKAYPGLCTKDKDDAGGEPQDEGGDGDIAISLKPSVLLLFVFVLCNVIVG